MSSFPRAVEKQYDEVDEEIVSKLELRPSVTILKAWFKNFGELRDSLGQLDALSKAECFLLLESLKCSAQILKARAMGAEVADSVVAYAREVAFVYDQFLAVHNHLKFQRTQQLKKILSADDDDQTNIPHAAAASQQQVLGMTMNLQSLVPDSEAGELAKSDIYKAPQSTTLSVLGHNFDAEDKARRKEPKHTAARLHRSEFVKAITEDYTETPQIHDDGFDQLDAESRKTLKRFEAEDHQNDQGDDSDNWSLPMKKRSRKTAELKKYKDIKTKQSLLRSGAELGELADFVGRINNEDNETLNPKNFESSSTRKSGKKQKVKKSSKTKLPKIKKRVK